MTRTYERINRIYPKDENGHTSAARSYVASIDKFTFAIYPGSNHYMTVTKNGESKTVYIEDSTEYTYNLLKTKRQAIDGAKGLYEFIDKALFEKFMDSHAWRVLDWIMDTMKSIEKVRA